MEMICNSFIYLIIILWGRGGRVAAHWTVVPMVTGSNPCEGKGLFPGPRASLSHPAPNGYLTLHVVRRLGNAWNPQSRGL